ncbi:MAG: flavin reductase [Burkholderiales bacterium]|nr:flavin reductase [Burkholderiales bacterium]
MTAAATARTCAPGDPAEQARRFRTLMGRFVTGVTIIATQADEGVAAMTANAVTAVSLDPLIVLACIRNESRLLAPLLARGSFSINVLAAGQDDISRHYGGRAAADSPARWLADAGGVPVLAGANASFLCKVMATHQVGDHTVVYGAVYDMRAAEPAAPALLYAGGRYADLPLPA